MKAFCATSTQPCRLSCLRSLESPRLLILELGLQQWATSHRVVERQVRITAGAREADLSRSLCVPGQLLLPSYGHLHCHGAQIRPNWSCMIRPDFHNDYFAVIPQLNCPRLKDLTVWPTLSKFNVIFRVKDLNSVGEYLDVIAPNISGKFKCQVAISPIIN